MSSIFIHGMVQFGRAGPFLRERKNDSFASFLEAGADQGVEVYLSNVERYDKRRKRVKRAWVYDGRWKQANNKKVELCYYHGKTRGIYKELELLKKKLNIPVVNPPAVETICDDKLLTYTLFPDLVPRTFPLHSPSRFYCALNMIPTDRVVLKPRFGSEGKGVFIYEKDDLLGALPRHVLAQEFIDSSQGIFGIPSVHDLRVMIVNGIIDHAYLRLPAEDSLICNAAQGGSKIFIDKEDLPQEVISIVERVDNVLRVHGTRVYTVDFMKDAQGNFRVIELNSKPGTSHYEGEEKVRYRFYVRVITAVKDMLG